MSSPTLSATRGHHSRHRVAWLSAIALSLALPFGAIAATVPAAYADDPVTYNSIILGVGSTETQRVVTWYTSANAAEKVEIATDSAFTTDVQDFSATVTANVVTTKSPYSAHSVISGLVANTKYFYRVGDGTTWSSTYSFATQSFEGSYDFLFFGDPQIGSSGDAVADGQGWSNTLDYALSATPKAELLVSGGDQVETANTETQWDSFLGNDSLREYPWVATIGNHDVGGKAYEQHLWTPNTDRSTALYQNQSATSTTSGGDYWFVYKDTLFIDLNSNAYANGSDDAHVSYVTSVINAHKAEAKYTVLIYHHSIYSPAAHANDADNSQRRKDFTTVFSKLGVDLVLQGHDHSYSRSYELKNGQKANADEKAGDDEVYVGPGGVIYVTANSASGSKYYDLTEPSSTANGGDFPADPTATPDANGHVRHYANSVENQEHVRTYIKVSVGKDSLKVQDIRASEKGDVNPAFDRGNVKWQGTTHNVGDQNTLAKGTVVDEVTIHPNHGSGEDIQVDVADTPGEFGWTIDGKNGLVDLGTATDTSSSYLEASGSINPIVVTDTRRTAAAWSVAASLTSFTDGSKTFGAEYLGWNPTVVTPGAGATAGATVASGYSTGGAGLSVSRTLASAEQGHERGEAKIGASLDLKIPATVDPGSYRATLTITALSE